MAKILFFAQGEHIAKHAQRMKHGMEDPGEMEVHLSTIENIGELAKKHIATDTEVVLARSTCAYVLRNANLPVSVVEIPISEEEIIRSFNKARRISPPGAPIGLLGFHKVISSMKVFSEILSIDIRLYEMFSTQQAMEQIEKARRDGVPTLITGIRCLNDIEAAGMNAVLLEASPGSIAKAYRQAREILYARTLEKKKARETHTILNSVSDGIVSFDAAGNPITVNHCAKEMLDNGGETTVLFLPAEQALVRRVIATGEEVVGHILERNTRKYAMRVVPIMMNDSPEGAIATLQEIRALQHMEATVRKGLQKGNVANYVFDHIKGGSDAIRETVETARSFAKLQSNVLLIGETGTGKELFAQSIHNASPRRDQPFVAVNCGAIPPELMVSELFGYDEGAFTGARRGGKMGLFELAHNGTIFLDEISEMDQIGQVNLLRALQERQIRRVGGNTVIPVDVRVIAASNTNLYRMVKENKFRRDLYYRLSVLVMKIPPLRERTSDIASLARHFLDQYSRQFGKKMTFSPSGFAALEAFSWDGNIRQLRNICEQIAAVAETPRIDGEYVKSQLRKNLCYEESAPSPAGLIPEPMAELPILPFADVVMIKGKPYSRAQLHDLLDRFQGRRELLAQKLGVCRTTLWKVLNKSLSE